MTNLTTPPPMSTVDPEVILARLKKENKFKNSMNWFYWIAGLSLFNSIMAAIGANFVFVIGLGITQLVDGIAIGLNERLVTNNHLFSIFGLIISVLFSGLFVLFGFLGNKKNKPAIIIGMVLYGLDAILTVVIGLYASTVFHGLALFGIFTGLRILMGGEISVAKPVTGEIQPIIKDHYYDNFR